MGRPRKSKVPQAENHESNHPCAVAKLDELAAEKAGVPDPVGAYEAVGMCPAIYKTHMINSYDVRPGPFATDGPIFQYGDQNSNTELAATSQWKPKPPDYSTISTPVSTQTNYGSTLNSLSPDSSMSGHAHSEPPPTCSCLSQLYLCLSSLSTLSSFPLSSHTLSTLYNAARTARSVIYCATCPQAFSTGVQNLMMLGTLLTVTADAWFGLTRVDAEALGKETVCVAYLASTPTDPEKRREYWKQWLRKVIKHGVIGNSVAPPVHAVQSQCLDSRDLLTLIEELEERQRVRHAACASGDDSQMWNGPNAPVRENERDYLCLKIIGNARAVIDRFGFDPEDLQNRELYSNNRPDEGAFAAWK